MALFCLFDMEHCFCARYLGVYCEGNAVELGDGHSKTTGQELITIIAVDGGYFCVNVSFKNNNFCQKFWCCYKYVLKKWTIFFIY